MRWLPQSHDEAAWVIADGNQLQTVLDFQTRRAKKHLEQKNLADILFSLCQNSETRQMALVITETGFCALPVLAFLFSQFR